MSDGTQYALTPQLEKTFKKSINDLEDHKIYNLLEEHQDQYKVQCRQKLGNWSSTAVQIDYDLKEMCIEWLNLCSIFLNLDKEIFHIADLKDKNRIVLIHIPKDPTSMDNIYYMQLGFLLSEPQGQNFIRLFILINKNVKTPDLTERILGTCYLLENPRKIDSERDPKITETNRDYFLERFPFYIGSTLGIGFLKNLSTFNRDHDISASQFKLAVTVLGNPINLEKVNFEELSYFQIIKVAKLKLLFYLMQGYAIRNNSDARQIIEELQKDETGRTFLSVEDIDALRAVVNKYSWILEKLLHEDEDFKNKFDYLLREVQ